MFRFGGFTHFDLISGFVFPFRVLVHAMYKWVLTNLMLVRGIFLWGGIDSGKALKTMQRHYYKLFLKTS